MESLESSRDPNLLAGSYRLVSGPHHHTEPLRHLDRDVTLATLHLDKGSRGAVSVHSATRVCSGTSVVGRTACLRIEIN